MDMYPNAERIQLACMASLVHLMKNSTRNALLKYGASLVMAYNSDNSSRIATNTQGQHHKHQDLSHVVDAGLKVGTAVSLVVSPTPVITKLVTNTIRAISTFVSNKSMYEYACAILLAGSRRGCFTAFSLDSDENKKATNKLVKSWNTYQDKQEYRRKRKMEETVGQNKHRDGGNRGGGGNGTSIGSVRKVSIDDTAATANPALQVQADVVDFSTSTIKRKTCDPIRVRLFEALSSASVAIYQGLATYHHVDIFLLHCNNGSAVDAARTTTMNHTLEVARCVLVELVGVKYATELVKHARESQWHGAAA